ncbi:energy transducer TonB family protein [Aquabacterium humicola]|uniref:energy transducer TonB family protein n=1 Tax=Aquabacterium humicola TaxID=3237377 RepID=UPI002542C377|nr:energy transducer TonB [Rubrivivax pictus]
MRTYILAAAGLCCINLASAQTAAEIAERMERAKRDAANPLRIIIEAAQVKRTKATETATPAPAPAPAPAAVARPTPAAAPAPTVAASPRPSRSETATAGATPSTRSASPAPAAVAEPIPTPEPTVAAAPASAVPAPAPEASAAMAAPTQLAATTPRAAPPAPPADAIAPLKLVRYVEPEIPSRIRSRLKASNEVTVLLKVNPDGSVAGADIRQTTSRALDAVVLDAVKQWRYDPVPEPREHAVQLVFNLSE